MLKIYAGKTLMGLCILGMQTWGLRWEKFRIEIFYRQGIHLGYVILFIAHQEYVYAQGAARSTNG